MHYPSNSSFSPYLTSLLTSCCHFKKRLTCTAYTRGTSPWSMSNLPVAVTTQDSEFPLQ